MKHTAYQQQSQDGTSAKININEQVTAQCPLTTPEAAVWWTFSNHYDKLSK